MNRHPGLWIFCLALWLGFSTPAYAEWHRTSEIELNTAYTLEQGAISVGLWSPLNVGITDQFQASIHPILLLLGQPSLAFRLRVTPVGDLTAAINLAGAFSFIERETKDGRTSSERIDDEAFGYPGTIQLTTTLTYRASSKVLVSAGGGIGLDFLGTDPFRSFAEFHLSTHVLASPKHAFMVQLMSSIPLDDAFYFLRPSAQAFYIWSFATNIQLAVGVGAGTWPWEGDGGTRTTIHVFPYLDLWFRL